jgi:hypothetical protein
MHGQRVGDRADTDATHTVAREVKILTRLQQLRDRRGIVAFYGAFETHELVALIFECGFPKHFCIWALCRALFECLLATVGTKVSASSSGIRMLLSMLSRHNADRQES